MKKCLFIYNPISGKSKKIVKKLDYIEKRLKEVYDVVDIVPTQYAGHAIDISRDACGVYDSLIFSGGDGTFSEVVKGIGERKEAPTLGFIPSGTVSDMANNYHIPRKIEKALDVCLKGKKTKIDVCKINDSYFTYVCGLGTYTDATFKTDVKLKKKYGRLAYFLQGAKDVFKVKNHKVKMTVGKKQYDVDSSLLLVLNSKSVAGFSSFNYKNKLGDGKFDVIIAKKPQIKTPLNVWKLFAKGAYGLIDDPNYMMFSTNKLSLEISDKHEWNLDGDPYKEKKLEIECLKKRLSLFVEKE